MTSPFLYIYFSVIKLRAIVLISFISKNLYVFHFTACLSWFCSNFMETQGYFLVVLNEV